MNLFERTSIAVRHLPGLRRAGWLWNLVRPAYQGILKLAGGRGLERNINGTDPIRVLPKHRDISEEYEPEFWRSMLGQVRTGDHIADVGAFIGLYTIAFARRIGPTGKVHSFEPDPVSFASLRGHVELNDVAGQVDLVNAAVGDRDGRVGFVGNSLESHIVPDSGLQVALVSLDSYFKGKRVDLMKIDVEGYEERVLRGAAELLRDRERRPRVLFVEMHPFAWGAVGTTSESILSLAKGFGYNVFTTEGQPVTKIDTWSRVILRSA